MNGKKGFTLVEMIAVIVIIAVLSIAAVTAYRGISEGAKRKTLDAKIKQLTTAAEKWTRDNYITSRTTISVNTLVVEGYVSADEVDTDGLARITNPVTGKNMICNTIDISFNQGDINTKYNAEVENCKLASQSIVDNNINLTVIDSAGDNKTGSGSIAKWTNKDIILIVNSPTYETKATSISYDFEGSTITRTISTLEKYTGSSFISKTEANKYYNVYYIEGSVLLNTNVIVTYDIPGEGTKSREYTVRIDQEEATASVESKDDWVTDETPFTILIDDGKGSGPKFFYLTTVPTPFSSTQSYTAKYKNEITDLAINTYYLWTEDNAGNRSKEYKLKFDINNADPIRPGCRIDFNGNEGLNGWYISDVTPSATNVPFASASGINLGFNTDGVPNYTAYAKEKTQTVITLPTMTEENIEFPYYCYVKSLAGLSSNNTRTLRIDKTPPTLHLDIRDADRPSRDKEFTVEVRDTYSGLRMPEIQYGFSISDTEPPRTWFRFFGGGITTKNPFRLMPTGPHYTLTGRYYLWLDTSKFRDEAGNYYPEQYLISNALIYDNEPPHCEVVGYNNECTTDGIMAHLICEDNAWGSGVNQMTCPDGHCPAHLINLKDDTIFHIRDNVDNMTEVTIGVESQVQYHSATCNGYATCSNPACGQCGGCATYLCCRPDNTDYCEYQYYANWDCTCWIPAAQYDCSCATKECGCETWGNWSGWYEEHNSFCTLPDCTEENRTVYHRRGYVCEGDFSRPGPNAAPEDNLPQNTTIITCYPGQYLQGANNTCTECPRGYYCPGGSWVPDSTDHGLNVCPNNYTSDPNAVFDSDCYIICEYNSIVVEPEKTCDGRCEPGYHMGRHHVSYGFKSGRCAPNGLYFTNKSFSYTFDTSSYNITLDAALNGTGSYTYTKTSEKNASLINTSFFTVKEDQNGIPYLSVAANATVNTYTIDVKATDDTSGANTTATITVEITKADSAITCLSPNYTGGSLTLASGSGCSIKSGNSAVFVGNYDLTCTGDVNHNDSTATCSIQGCNRWEFENYATSKSLTDQKWRYFDASCNRVNSGWRYTGQDYVNPDKSSILHWYFFEDGYMKIGWYKHTDGCWYYLDPKDRGTHNGKVDGAALTGNNYLIDGKYYSFCTSGRIGACFQGDGCSCTCS